MPLRRRGHQFRRHPRADVGRPPPDEFVDVTDLDGFDATGHRPVAPDRFMVAVEEALAGIPAPFDRLLETVAVVVEDWPSDDQLDAGGATRRNGLYGLYEGVPRTAWMADVFPIPNKISIFRGPLEDDFPDSRRLVRQIRRTVVHELAHHAGIGDRRLRELGLD